MKGYLLSIETDRSIVEVDTRSKKEKNMKAVVQRDENGQIVGEYPSISSAQRETGIRNISDCVLGKRKTAGGYTWHAAE